MQELLPVKEEERWEVYDRARGACICPSCTGSSMVRTGERQGAFLHHGHEFPVHFRRLRLHLPGESGLFGAGVFKEGLLQEGSEKDQRWEKV